MAAKKKSSGGRKKSLRITLTVTPYVNGMNKSILPQNRRKFAEAFFNKLSDREKTLITTGHIKKMPSERKARYLKGLMPKRKRNKKS